jgi:autotransporter-associated beta strand protein
LTVSQGTLAVTQKLSVYNGTGPITLGGGSGLPTLQFIGSYDDSMNRPINLLGDAALDASGAPANGGDDFYLGGGISGNNHNLTLSGTSTAGGEIDAPGMNLGSGSLTKTGPGLWQLDVANTLAGTTITAGTLSVLSDSNLGASGSEIVAFGGAGNGTLEISSNASAAFSSSRSLVLSANGAIEQDDTKGATFSGPISGSGELFKTGPGNLILSNSTNSFGGTVVDAGMLTVTTIGALPTNQSLEIDAGGTFVFDPLAAQNSELLAASPGGALAAVPEPGSLALLVAALCSAGIYCRFRRRSRER